MNLKYKEAYTYWKNYPGKKLKWITVRHRVNNLGRPIEKAVKLYNKTTKGLKVTAMGKECSKCRVFKGMSHFVRDKSRAFGRSCDCKECRNKYKREYRKRASAKKVERASYEKWKKSERWKQIIKAYALYYYRHWNNIKILKWLNEMHLHKREDAKYNVRKFIKRIWKEKDFPLIFK